MCGHRHHRVFLVWACHLLIANASRVNQSADVDDAGDVCVDGCELGAGLVVVVLVVVVLLVVELLGVVLNGLSPRRIEYYSNYRYYRSYKKYYGAQS